MGSPSGRRGDIIGDIFEVKASETLKVTRDGGSSADKIFMEKEDG